LIFNLFSNPFEGDFLTAAEYMACRNACSVVARANEEAHRLDMSPTGLLGESITPERCSTRLWTPEIGAARMALRRGITTENWAWLSGQISLVAFLSGVTSFVNFEAPGAHPMSIAGHSIQSARLRVCGEADSLKLEGVDGQTLLSLTRYEPPDVAPVWVESMEDIIRLGDAAIATFSSASWMDYWLPDAVQGPASADRDARRCLIERVSDVLADCSPQYFLWIASLLRQVAILEPNQTRTQSQSFPLWPGHIHVSQTTFVTMFIALIHECSHQYFHMALWCGPVAKSDSPLVFSKLAGRNRPLDKVLLGFHAFGNVLLALPTLLPTLTGNETLEYHEQLLWTREVVDGLYRALQPNWERHLEQSGQQIYQPLRERLIAARMLQQEH
jgi:HEXXH motif-containing protein